MQLRDEALLKRIGNRIKELRKVQNLTQDQLAFECGVMGSQIVRIEGGSLNSSISTLYTIAKVLDVSIDDLCG